MCGIACVHGRMPGKEEVVRKMLGQILHRGNSHYEIAEVGNCALGANRLEIVGRGSGRQPKGNENGAVLAVLNGEVYNHKEMKNDLEGRGHKFESDCDTEVLPHLYEEFGAEMLEKIDSEMFAFVIYDAKKNSIFAARDRWGVKPLYWARDGEGNLYFASEIKALSVLPQVKRVWMFPPGHYFMDGRLRRYYRPDFRETMELGEEEAAAKLKEAVDEAVKKRVQTDLPIGIFLSGGVDSTAILATALRYNKDVTAVIVGKKDAEDVVVAKRYCRENRVKYVELAPPDEKEIFGMIEEVVGICESFEPNVVRQSAISYFIAKAAKDAGLRLVLCGEGADELFLGYPEFKGMGKRKAREVSQNFLKSLCRTQFQRVDRTSMHFTIEVRVPFFDEKVVQLANSIPVGMKVKEGMEKWVLRKAMGDRLPAYIAERRKVVLSEGAGYKGNQPITGLFCELAGNMVGEEEFEEIKKEFAEWNIRTREEAFYFKIFRKFGYDKALFNRKRVAACAAASVEDGAGGIVALLRSRKFNRNKPRSEERLYGKVREAMKKKKPIKLFMLWGVWKKERPNDAEMEALGIIEELMARVRGIYPRGCELTLVLTDRHAEINLIDRMQIYRYDSYLPSFERLAISRGHKVVRISEVLGKRFRELVGIRKNMEEIRKNEIWASLLSSASKYYGGKDAEEGAGKYVECRLAEKPNLERAFRECIFLTYNGPEFDMLAPELPTLYLFSTRKKTIDRPWFRIDA